MSGFSIGIQVFFGSFSAISLSQAAACDGILYQVGPEDDNTNPGPGVLPI